jgi:uncharacterized protein (TIGR03083 family)
MPLSPLTPIDTRTLFRPVSDDLVRLLRGLASDDWNRPTVAGAWTVRDVLAHLVDLTFRRLSFHRDRMTPPPPARPIRSDRDFIDFINGLNADWVATTRRLSPRVLTDLFELAARDLADWFESVSLDEPALFGVSWAGERTSENWFDIGREFTELWHHQEQIRMAVRAASLTDPRYLHAVIAVAMRGLPHAFRDVAAEPGTSVTVDVEGPAGGHWTLVREPGGWTLSGGSAPGPAARVRLDDGTAWKLLFNALDETAARAAATIEGRADLATPFLRARSVIV